MNYLIAPDSFKGTLTSKEAAGAIAEGIRDQDPDAVIHLLPMADGGEGTLDVLETALQEHGVRRLIFSGPVRSQNPGAEYLLYREGSDLAEESDAGVSQTGASQTGASQTGERIAVIESARLIGLEMMQGTNIMQRSSSVLGDALREILDRGIRHIVIALGGSGCNDGGLGMLVALGMRAWDIHGQSVSPDLNGLLQLHTLDTENLLPALKGAHIEVLCDVDAPLIGERGASRMYGRQKGLDEAQCSKADKAMKYYAGIAEQSFAVRAQPCPGSGAAGGLGFALALLGGHLQSGAEYIMRQSGFHSALSWADWLITGEGASDAQTLQGKIPLLLARDARRAGKKTALISGRIEAAQMQSGKDRLARYFDRMIAVRGGGDMPEVGTHRADHDLRIAAAKLVQ